MDSVVYKLAFLLITLCILPVQTMANPEGEALSAVRSALEDPGNVFASWDAKMEDPCTWLYVTCDDSVHVVKLDLQYKNLSGTLSPKISQLSHLQNLEIQKNSLNGSIPESLGDLKNLISIDLYENNFTGEIPASLRDLPSLVFLRLNNNRLSGNIPTSLTSISALQVLDLSYNNLDGPVPRNGSFSQFTNQSFVGNPNLCGEVVGKPCAHQSSKMI